MSNLEIVKDLVDQLHGIATKILIADGYHVPTLMICTKEDVTPTDLTQYMNSSQENPNRNKDVLTMTIRLMAQCRPEIIGFVVITEAYMHNAAVADSDDTMAKLHSGEVTCKELFEAKDTATKEILMLSVCFRGKIDYILQSEIVRDSKGAIINVKKGELIHVRDKDTTPIGRFSNFFGEN